MVMMVAATVWRCDADGVVVAAVGVVMVVDVMMVVVVTVVICGDGGDGDGCGDDDVDGGGEGGDRLPRNLRNKIHIAQPWQGSKSISKDNVKMQHAAFAKDETSSDF